MFYPEDASAQLLDLYELLLNVLPLPIDLGGSLGDLLSCRELRLGESHPMAKAISEEAVTVRGGPEGTAAVFKVSCPVLDHS